MGGVLLFVQDALAVDGVEIFVTKFIEKFLSGFLRIV